VDAYDLILKDKERLLSFSEPTRVHLLAFRAARGLGTIPNVFVMCMLKHSDNTVSRRQEVGRGLRLSVDQNGDRMDNPAVVHDINVLTVVASESYKNFVAGLQKEIADTLTARATQGDGGFFHPERPSRRMRGRSRSPRPWRSKVYRYLVKNDYSDDGDQITSAYHQAKEAGTLAGLAGMS
jgi:type III restriction enzyme